MRLFALLSASLLCVLPIHGQSNPQMPRFGKLRESGFVKIGGIEQWIDIRSEDAANPPLLVLHGGPGATWDPLLKLFEPWEKYFTMIEWDQRGAGRTYTRNRPDSANITIDGVVADGLEVAEYLSRRFDGRKLILLGHSWGSLIGVRMVARRPDLFCAYVGTGQEVNKQRAEALGYMEVLLRARLAQNSEAERALLSISAPPYNDAKKFGIERQWENVFAPKSEQKFNSIDYVRSLYPPDFTNKDMADRMKGASASNRAVYGDEMSGPMLAVDLFKEPLEFRVPMFFIQGELDDVTPTALVRRYLRSIRAPRKSLAVMPDDGHLAIIADPGAFLERMRQLLGSTNSCTLSNNGH